MIGEKTIRTTWDLAHEYLETNSNTKPFLIEDFLITKKIDYDEDLLKLLTDMVQELSSRRNSQLPLKEQIKAAVDDEIYLMKKRIAGYYKLTNKEANEQ